MLYFLIARMKRAGLRTRAPTRILPLPSRATRFESHPLLLLSLPTCARCHLDS